jgi:hypothetical protein
LSRQLLQRFAEELRQEARLVRERLMVALDFREPLLARILVFMTKAPSGNLTCRERAVQFLYASGTITKRPYESNDFVPNLDRQRRQHLALAGAPPSVLRHRNRRDTSGQRTLRQGDGIVMSPRGLLELSPSSSNRREELYKAIDTWTNAPAINQLVALFGGQLDPAWALERRLKYLSEFSARWDFRRGAERLNANQTSLNSDDEMQVHELARDLGLTITAPPRLEAYDYVLVLGGIALSCKLRTEHAAELIDTAAIQARTVALLGASRTIPDNERAIADSFAPTAATEFDMMNSAAESAFRLNDGYDESVNDDANHHLISIIRRYHRLNPPDIVSLCAPSGDPSRRANTEDTYRFLAKSLSLKSGHRVLICSSQIYFPFHSFGAMRMLSLPYDVYIEVVGFPIERASGSAALRGTNNLLQEIRSGIQAALSLKEALDMQP